MFVAANTVGTAQHAVFTAIKKMIALRKASPILGESDTQILLLTQPNLLAYKRSHATIGTATFVANFSEFPQTVSLHELDVEDHLELTDQISDTRYTNVRELTLAPYQILWLTK